MISRSLTRVVVLSSLLAAALCTRSAQAQGAAAASTPPADRLDFFFGLDGSKQPQDLGINANMGARFAANMGLPLARKAGLGAQIGAAMNFSDAAVHVLDQIEGTSRRSQTYLTFGLFQQATSHLSWILDYDFLNEHYYDTFSLSQLRGQVGYRVTSSNEVGAWVTKGLQGDNGVMSQTAVRLDPISQVNGFLRHTWPTAARTMIWAGVASHHNVVVLLPDNSRDRHVLVYGGQLELPLNNQFSVTGSGNFLTPAATGTVDAYLGVTFYPRRRGPQTGRDRFAAPTSVANNPEFPVDLHR